VDGDLRLVLLEVEEGHRAKTNKEEADDQISCVDVFAMPQSGTTVTVESVDHVFQTKMLDMLKQTGR